MRNTLKKIFQSNFILTTFIFIPILFIANPVREKYMVSQYDHEVLSHPGKIYFEDINLDGNSERVEFYIGESGLISVKLYDPNHRGQANSATFAQDTEVRAIFANYDGNESKEIYFTGVRNDSLFVNVLDYSEIGETEILSGVKEYFIYAVKPETDYGFGLRGLFDLDNDGYKELIVLLNAGYALQPRILLSYNFITQQFQETPFSGSKKRVHFVADMNNDTQPELWGGTFAFRNYVNINVPYTDTCSWLIAYDNTLDYLFEPILISPNKTDAEVYPVSNENENLILVFKERVYDISSPVQFLFFTAAGKLVKELEIPLSSDLKKRRSPVVVITDSTNYEGVHYIDHLGNIYQLNNQLGFNKSHAVENLHYSRFVEKYDLDYNGKPEYLLKEVSSNEYFVLDNKLKNAVKFQVPNILGERKRVGIVEQENQNSVLYFQVGNDLFFYRYYKNPLWSFRFLIWAAIFGGIYAFLLLLQYFQKERIRYQVETRQQIKELQFRVITSQLNPHFTFNALNIISSSVYDPQKPEIYDRFTTFSRLIRSIVSDSDRVSRSLRDEMNFTRDFLKIQKLRFKEAFDYSFDIDNTVNLNIQVPKLIIQIYVENAIKHAFPNNFGCDMLKIRAIENKNHIKIEIEDNGIGRENARKNNHTIKNTGKGLTLMNDYIALLNKQNYRKIKISIIDLREGGTGTLVKILIPLVFNYKIK